MARTSTNKSRNALSKPPQHEEVDGDGFPISYEDPEEVESGDDENPAEKRNRQQKLLNAMLPPQSEPPPSQIHVVSKAAPKPQLTPEPVTAPTQESIVSKLEEPQMSKIEAVRKALASNPKLSGENGVAYVLEKYGVTLSAATFNNYKSVESKKVSEAGTATKTASAPAPSASKAPPAPAAAAQSSIIGKIRAIKELLKTTSPEEIKSLVDELAE